VCSVWTDFGSFQSAIVDIVVIDFMCVVVVVVVIVVVVVVVIFFVAIHAMLAGIIRFVTGCKRPFHWKRSSGGSPPLMRFVVHGWRVYCLHEYFVVPFSVNAVVHIMQ